MALADPALHFIPEEVKDEISEEGYGLDRIISDLMELRGNVFELKTERSIIKIWLE